MGQIRSKDIKKGAFSLVAAYHDQLTVDFEQNKKVITDLNLGLTKPMRNRLVGYTTRVMRRTLRTVPQ